MHGSPLPPAQAAALEYCAHGWRVVPVPRASKSPVEPGWPSNEYTAQSIGDGNVGVILGPVSGDLVDIDLDSKAALELAPYFLPPTLTFGRASKPRSHWLYTCANIRSANYIFRFAGEVERVEIRAKNASNDVCGHQSVFPGSVHESGEAIDWDALDSASYEEPQPIAAGELTWAVSRLAVACVIIDGWGEGAQRNTLTMAYAGGLLAMGWAADEVRDLLQAVRECAGDDEEQSRKDEGAVERTIAAFEAGTPVTGFSSLVRDGFVEQSKIKDIERHAKTPAARARELKLAQTKTGKGILERMVREAQETDALVRVADAIASAATPLEAQDENTTRLGRLVDIGTPPEPFDYVCPGLCIAPGKISAIVGYAGTGKGPFLDLFALCVASGRPFLGHKVERRKVAFLDFETGPLVELRLKRLANALNLDLAQLQQAEWLTLIHGMAPIDEEYCALVESSLERGMLLCIDSYTSAVPGDQNDSAIAEVAFRLGSISAALGVTVFAATHARKTQQGRQGDDLEAVSGHNALAAAMQTAIILTRPDGADKALLEAKCARAPEEPFETFRFRWEDVTAPDAKETRGGRLKAEKWGLRAVCEEREHSGETLGDMKAAIEAEEAPILLKMQAHYPGGQQAPVAELVGSRSAKNAEAKRSAIRNLIRSGRLVANYHWQRGRGLKAKQLVWLPCAGAEIGTVQS